MTLSAALVSFGCGCFLAILLAPLVARLARRWAIVDLPDGNRKSHAEATPLGGGVAVALATVGAMAATFIVGLVPVEDHAAAISAVRGFIPAAIVLLLVGMVDDVIGLTGIYKLIGQVFAVSLLVAGGYRFDLIGVFGFPVELGDFSIPFTIFFCLGAINAFNLIDGSDALAASVGAVVALTLGIISGFQGDVAAAILCFALAGSLAGFLPFNAPPARLYLGDTGSMMIGMAVAAVAVHSSIKRHAAFALAVPLAVCAVPILDAAAALVRRITTGQSVFTPDRGHLHHALLHRGWSAGRTALFVAGLTALTCTGALASYFLHHEAFAFAAIIGVFAALAATRIFGHAEVRLLTTQAASAMQSAFRRRSVGRQGDTEQKIQIHGRRRWEMIWSALREAAPGYNLAALKLNVNIPRLHESFFAAWRRNEEEATDSGWRLTLPLSLDGREIGKLQVTGRSSGNQAIPEMQQFLEYLEPLEDQLRRLVLDVADGSAWSIDSDPPADETAVLPTASPVAS